MPGRRAVQPVPCTGPRGDGHAVPQPLVAQPLWPRAGGSWRPMACTWRSPIRCSKSPRWPWSTSTPTATDYAFYREGVADRAVSAQGLGHACTALPALQVVCTGALALDARDAATYLPWLAAPARCRALRGGRCEPAPLRHADLAAAAPCTPPWPTLHRQSQRRRPGTPSSPGADAFVRAATCWPPIPRPICWP